MTSNNELSEIQHFYKNKTFLITGVTGFVGKLILEKILRILHPKNVYVLIRDKNELKAEARCMEILDSSVFEPLKRTDADFFKKVTLIRGDLQQPNLDLSQNDKNILLDEVECIFHCASASKLDETLQNATNVNVGGTIGLLQMAKEMEHLMTIVYISTVYSHFPRHEIHEEFYEPTILAENLLKVFENSNENEARSIQEKLLTEWPNAYTFTMAVIEDFIKRKIERLPISIIRPSLLLPSETEPVTGYVESLNGLYGNTATYALGINRVNYYKSGILDAIPVDYVVNLSIVAGWYSGLQKIRLQRGDVTAVGLNIYHCVSSQEKPITLDEWTGVVHTVTRDFPSVKMLQLPTQFNTSCYYHYKLLTLLLHTFMAFLCDVGLKIVGKTPSIMKMYDKMHKTQELFSPYFLKQWYFSNENTQKLLKRMSFKDRGIFNFDILNLNWQNYLDNYAKGVRVYLLKDPMSTLSEARLKQEKMLRIQLISTGITIVILYVILKIVFRFFLM